MDCPDCGKELLVPLFETQAAPPSLPPAICPAPLGAPATPPPNEGGEYTCPVCWLCFDRGDIMHVAVHDSLRGDAVLGEDAQQRCLATRFESGDPAANAPVNGLGRALAGARAGCVPRSSGSLAVNGTQGGGWRELRLLRAEGVAAKKS